MATKAPAGSYSTPAAARAAGLTARQLDCWMRAGAVAPEVRPTGTGSKAKWSPDAVARLRAIAEVVADLRSVVQIPVTMPLVAELWRQLCESGVAVVGTDRVRITARCEPAETGA